MKRFFKYLLFIVLSIFLSNQISASSVFSSIEKKGARVYELANGVGDISTALRTKIINTLPTNRADDLIAELSSNSALKTAMEADEISPLAWKRIDDGGIADFKTKSGYVETLKKVTKYENGLGGTGNVKYYRVQGGQGASVGQTSQELLTVQSNGNITFNSNTNNLNISTDTRLHADYYLECCRNGGEIVEFEVPKWLDDQIKSSAVPQYRSTQNLLNPNSNAPKIVDPTQIGDPFELPPHWHQLIEQNYIQGSAKIIQ